MNYPSSDYMVLREQIKSGDLLLCSGTGIFSQLIQNATKSKWSHVAFILRLDDIDRVMVLESVESIGVRTVPLSHYLYNYNGSRERYPGELLLARHQDFEQSKTNTISQYAVDFLGLPYNKQEIASIASRIIAGNVGFELDAPEQINPVNGLICSEYVYLCFKSIGIEIPFDRRGFIAPKDFKECSNVETVGNL